MNTSKRVRFNPVVKIRWFHCCRECRTGNEWIALALSRKRFERRIDAFSNKITPILLAKIEKAEENVFPSVRC